MESLKCSMEDLLLFSLCHNGTFCFSSSIEQIFLYHPPLLYSHQHFPIVFLFYYIYFLYSLFLFFKIFLKIFLLSTSNIITIIALETRLTSYSLIFVISRTYASFDLSVLWIRNGFNADPDPNLFSSWKKHIFL